MQSDIPEQSGQNQKPGFSLFNLMGIIWSVHVLIAALLFPRFLLPNPAQNAQDIQKERIYTGFRIFVGTFILFFNIFSVIVLFTRSSLIDAAKVLFILGAWILLGIIYILFNHLRDIYILLTILEDDAIQSRDQSVMLIRAGQAALRAQNLKLYGEGEPEHFSFPFLLKKIGPLAMLVMQKSNVKDIAIEALKLALSGTQLLKYLF